MWLTVEYEATTLFSLKPATSTASGGKTLLVPTPFAIKMALVDIACRVEGIAAARRAWGWIQPLRVALSPAQRIVVNNTFIKVLKPRRNPAAQGSQDQGYFGRTITYREYAYLHDPFGIAFEVTEEADTERLAYWLVHLNYLGKRGSFVQMVTLPALVETLPQSFIAINGQIDGFAVDAILTQLDDTGEKVTFDQIDIYNDRKLRMGVERVLHHIALPYRLVSSSRGYSYYERSMP